MGALNHKL